MSDEVAIVAIIQPAPGKFDRLREAVIEGIEWIKANEPDTLGFSLYTQEDDDGVKLFMFERYSSQAALEKHEASDHYKEFFTALKKEELLSGAPIICKGKYCHAFQR